MANSDTGKIRIIGGSARSRHIKFHALDHLRPTPDRVRETLFNWLGSHLNGATCLDLFAGSGALGFEALSRGAGQVYLVESNRKIASDLKINLDLLSFQNASVENCRAESFLKTTQHKFHIVFMDPPYSSDLLQPTINLSEQLNILEPGALVYLEQRKNAESPTLPETWHCHRQQECGEVLARLYHIH
ncbi:MAG: 16S rRNA (guanine966-N2)-methyltransferase [Parasphingorhabdus sp.]|jgi:16S rRNA (guanine966-N2)-methyltransferase